MDPAAVDLAAVERETTASAIRADASGCVTWVNDVFEAMFGWRRDEIVGRPITALMPRAFHDAHNLGFSRFLATGRPTILNRPLTLRAVRKDGEEFDAEHLIVAERRDGRWEFGAIVRRRP